MCKERRLFGCGNWIGNGNEYEVSMSKEGKGNHNTAARPVSAIIISPSGMERHEKIAATFSLRGRRISRRLWGACSVK